MKKIIELYEKYKEIINYLIVGGITTLINLATYYFCVFTFLNPENPIELQTANIIAWLTAVVFAYFTNRKYVFESKETNKLKEGFKFFIARLITLLVDMAVMGLGVSILKFNDKIIKIISQVLVIVGNYVISKVFVFKKNK